MNPFKTLNIEPTDDKKAIKKAYAVLIKQYKPDENPEKFQEIQAAYKMALSMRQCRVQQNDGESESVEPHQVTRPETQKLDESFSLQPAQVDEEALAEQKQQEQLIENLFQQLHQMAFAPLAVKSKLENWKFIEKYHEIEDLSLKPQLAQHVFEKIAQYNLFQKKQNNTLLIEPKILKYLDSVFDWSNRWQEYRLLFPSRYFAVTIDILNEKNNTFSHLANIGSRILHVIRRLYAFLVDMFLFLMFSMFLLELFLPDIWSTPLQKVMLIMAFFLLSELLLKEHQTLGKRYLNLIIIDKYGNLCTKKLILLRQFVFYSTTFLPLSLWIFGTVKNSVILDNWFQVIVFINAISILAYKKAFHDMLCNTDVILRPA